MSNPRSAKTEIDQKSYERIAAKYGLKLGGSEPLRHKTLFEIDKFFEKNHGIHLEDLANDPQNPFTRFMKLLRAKKFPQGGENATRFLEALTKGPKEKKFATDLLRRMEEGTEVLTQRKEKNAIAEMEELRQEESAEEATTSVSSAVATITTSADSLAQYKDVIKMNKGEIGHYQPEKLPKNVAKDYKNISELMVLQEEAASLTRQLYLLSKDPKSEKNKVIQLQKKAIEARLEAVDDSMDKVVAEITGTQESPDDNPDVANKLLSKIRDFSENVVPALEKEKNRQEALKEISKMFGVPDINRTRVIELLKPIKEGDLSSQRERIEITGIEFDDMYGKEEEEMDLPKSEVGKAMIGYRYLDRDGREKTLEGKISYLNFLKNFIYIQDGYETETLDEQKERDPNDAHRYVPQVGQEFERRMIESLDEEEGIKYKFEEFTVKSIGKNGQIVLDKPVVTTHMSQIPEGAGEEVKHDRIQQIFTPAQFTKLLLQYDCKTDGKICSDEILGTIHVPETLQEPREKAKGNLVDMFDKIDLASPSYSEMTNKLDVEEMPTEEMMDEMMEEIPDEMPEEAHQEHSEGHAEHGAGHEEHGEHDDKEHGNDHSGHGNGHGGHGGHGDRLSYKRYADPKIAPSMSYKEIITDRAGKFHEMKDMGIMNKWWTQTTFLSANDVWKLFKSCWDYWLRRFERRQKERYSSAAQNLKLLNVDFGSEMRRVKQSAQDEEVHQFQEGFKNKGIFEVQDRLRHTNNADEFKACIEVLIGKGEMRWDDIEFWENANRFLKEKGRMDKLIPIPTSGDPNAMLSADEKHPYYRKTGMTFISPAIDALWGEGTGPEFMNKNKSTYKAERNKWYEEGDELEGVTGGHGRRLGQLLEMHKRGQYVSPHEYEGLIIHAITKGKSSFKEKIYYLIEGAAAKNHHGETILSFDRIAHLDGEVLNLFPVLDYFCHNMPREEVIDPKTGKKKREKYKVMFDDIKAWIDYWDGDNEMAASPTGEIGDRVEEYIWKYFLPSWANKTRTEKGSRNAQAMDHDDMFAFFPLANSQVVENMCRSVGGGGQFLVTQPGYANGAPGYSQHIKAQAIYGNTEEMGEGIKSYVTYMTIMRNRFHKDDDKYAKLKSNEFKKPVVADYAPKFYMDQIDRLMEKIAYELQDADLSEAIKDVLTDTSTWNEIRNPELKQDLARIEENIRLFNSYFDKALDRYPGGRAAALEKIRQVTLSTELEGMSIKTGLEKDMHRIETGEAKEEKKAA